MNNTRQKIHDLLLCVVEDSITEDNVWALVDEILGIVQEDAAKREWWPEFWDRGK